MERKLASIQLIESLTPIDGADFIEKARVMGWDTIVKKGEFKEGDLCVFFEIDSIVPDTEVFAFLGGHRRLKTKKMRGVLSQGLALPISIIPHHEIYVDLVVGAEVTELLGVTKYEPEVKDAQGNRIAFNGWPFPFDIPKTDEIRIQSATELLGELTGKPYIITVKLDGASVTAYWDEQDGLVMCSRNYRLMPEAGGREYEYAKRTGLADKLKYWPELAFQGELCGPGIQKNRLNLKETEWFVFNVWDRQQHTYLPMDMTPLLLKRVPVEETGESFSYTLDQILEKADGIYAGTANRREGIVIRTNAGYRSNYLGGRLSFKAISNKFLLKDED